MKITRLILLVLAFGAGIWLALRRDEQLTRPAPRADESTAPSALELERRLEQVREQGQEVPCRPGDPLCEGARDVER